MVPVTTTERTGPDASAGAMARRSQVLVLGCGISGLVTARTLARRGVCVRLVDQYPAAGGNHISVAVEGRVFDIGAIHFTGHDSFFRVFPEVKAGCLERRLTAQKLSADMKLRRFPMEASDFLDLPLGAKASVLASLVLCRMRPGRSRDAADFMERAVGRAFFRRSGLRHYAERLFGVAPEEIDREFGERRLTWLTRRTGLRANLRALARRLARGRAPASDAFNAADASGSLGLVRSAEGFARHYEAALAGLRADGVEVHLGLSIRRIARCAGGGMRMETERGDFLAERIVSTMPIPLVCELAGLPPPELRGVELLSLFVVFEGPRRFTGTVLYNFHHEGGWKRLTVLSDIYDPGAGSGHLTVEVPCRAGAGPGAEGAFARFAAHARQAGLFEGRLRLVGHHALPDAYPLLDIGCGARRRLALDRLASAGIDGVGRHGTFDYIPHQSVACAEALAFTDAIAATAAPGLEGGVLESDGSGPGRAAASLGSPSNVGAAA